MDQQQIVNTPIQPTLATVSPATLNTCPVCHQLVKLSDYFCANCGKQLKVPPPSISFVKQLLIYSVSVLLPPFGLRYAIPYILQKDNKARQVGLIALVLTILSLLITIKITIDMVNGLTQSINSQIGTFGL